MTGLSSNPPSSDIAFTSSVKAIQSLRGSRPVFERVEARGGFRTKVTPQLKSFLEDVDTAYLATASAKGQPYAQHRGGPKGFIKVLDDSTLAFVNFTGNRQYLTAGNLAENDRAFLFLMDYQNRRRIKLWGCARFVDDAALVERLSQPGYDGEPEGALVFKVEAWDVNCPQHIPQKFSAGQVASVVTKLQERIALLEAENVALKAAKKD